MRRAAAGPESVGAHHGTVEVELVAGVVTTIHGRRIAADNPLKSPGEPIQAGISASLAR